MNWLAHVTLSKPDAEFRLGNLLADLVKGRDRAGMPAAFLDGVRVHQVIDGFTDSHPVVHQSRARIGPGFRHATGILIDVFYDHFLALDFERYAGEPLAAFTAGVYQQARECTLVLPTEARAALDRMASDDRLNSYATLDGMTATLRRVSLRLMERTGKDFELERGTAELVTHFDGLRNDFAAFFPELQAHVAAMLV
jgi:acyl carrier protein phosphodiesterase